MTLDLPLKNLLANGIATLHSILEAQTNHDAFQPEPQSGRVGQALAYDFFAVTGCDLSYLSEWLP